MCGKIAQMSNFPDPTIVAGYLPIVIPAFFIVVLVFILVVKAKDRKRAKQVSEETSQWAAARGWQYRGIDKQLVNQWDVPVFRSGGKRKATDIMFGAFASRRGATYNVMSFQYQYTVSTEDNSNTFYLHVVAVQLPSAVPSLALVPEGRGTRVLRSLGGQDIQFESEAFNRAWRVTADNLPFAHAVIHPQVMELLSVHGPTAGCYFLRGSTLIYYGFGLQTVARVDQQLSHAVDLVDLIPGFVWQDYAL